MKRKLMQLLLCVCMALMLAVAAGAAGAETGYLTFSSDSSFTLETANGNRNWDGTLEYSTDAVNWTEWYGKQISSVNGKLYLRGTDNTYITNGNNKQFVLTGTAIACSGNIETLLDYETVGKNSHPPMKSNCFAYLFKECANLTEAPELPATTLATACYSGMFIKCTSLTEAPELPATTLKNSCYSYMFSQCTNLTKAPDLPAEVLKQKCYRNMFQECTSLTEAPDLPAETLATECYAFMFYMCTNLTKAPSLSALNLAESCCMSMFSSCSSLTEAPALHATVLAKGCYQYMFNECTSLTKAPVLPATTLDVNCYQGMFSGCSSLTKAPDLPATTLAVGCYQSMFSKCTNLSTIPVLAATALKKNCYTQMFFNCENLRLSTEKTSCYSSPWSIPAEASPTDIKWNSSMFGSNREPAIGKIYYIAHSNENTWVYAEPLPTAAGSYVLQNDLILTDNWTVPGDTTICLNGNTLILNGFTITIPQGSSLSLCDCDKPEEKAVVDMTSGGGFIVNGEMAPVEGKYTVTTETNDKTITITNAEDYTVKLSPIPPSLEVYAGNKRLTAGQDYTYDSETGSLTVYKTAITGNLLIKESTEEKTVRYNFAPSHPTVHFEANGGTDLPSLTRAFGATVNLSRYVTAKADADFTGWYLDADCTLPAPKSFKLTVTTVLYAGWQSHGAEAE